MVIQEIFGVNHHIRAVCDRLAGEGYVAIAPSIFDRIDPISSAATRPTKSPRRANSSPIRIGRRCCSDTQAAIDAVKKVGPVGIIGFCLGGSVAFLRPPN